MQIVGEKGLGKILKIVLIVSLVLAVPTIIFFPLLFKHMKTIYSIFIIYPNGILMFLITLQFIKLFESLEKNSPFTYINVKILKKTSLISLIMSIMWFLDLLFLIFIIHNTYINYIIVFVFLTVLFFGVSIALLILSELFNQAVKYKEENDLTI